MLHESWIVVANILIAYLLINAALVRTYALLTICAVVTVVAVITFFEVPVAQHLLGNVNATYLQSIAINLFQSVWLLGILLILRAGGYRLAC